MPEPFANDGDMPFGTFVITVNAVDYVLDNWTPSRPANIVEQTGTKGEATRWAASRGFVTATATCQMEADDTAYLQQGDEFTYDDGTNGSETWSVVECSEPKEKNAPWVQTLTFRKMLN